MKHLIKRAQSQAGLSFAERVNVRPKVKRNKLLLLLVLFMTAATGAWAQVPEDENVYSNALNTKDLFDKMTNIDANNDGGNEMNGLWLRHDNLVTYNYSANAADDWLVTPELKLKAGVTYTIALEAWKPAPELNTYTETFEVKVGTDATADNLSAGTVAIATTEVTTSWTTYKGTFTPTEDGTYYVGIHATSPANQNHFCIRNLTVDIKYYTVSLRAGTEDAKNWTITSGENSVTGDELDGLAGLEEGDEVTLNYSGRLKVKSVTAVQVPNATDLSMLDCAGEPRTDGRWTANCYMVHKAGDYKLPLVYGNAIKAGQANTAAYTGVESESNNTTLTFPNHAGQPINAPWITKKTTGTGVDKGMGIAVTQAELLWQDAEGLVTAVDIDGNYLTLTVGKDATTQEGNAVVAAKDADGTIVWSWHIWVTNQTFADADLTTITTTNDTQTGTQGKDWQIYKVTPVNLGWVGGKVSTGTNTFYQWGRKDPFIGTGDVDFVESTNATIADHIKNPTKFYNVKIEKGTDQKTETHYYPCTESYYNLWNATQTKETSYSYAKATVKTVYDPCPAGFCVPTSNLYWYIYNIYKTENKIPDWDDTNNGFSVNIGTSNLFFPATGQRLYTNGKLDYVDTDGRYWSAYAYGDSFGVYGHILYFWYDTNSKNWDTANKDRAYGFPVRAVAEAPVAEGE